MKKIKAPDAKSSGLFFDIKVFLLLTFGVCVVFFESYEQHYRSKNDESVDEKTRVNRKRVHIAAAARAGCHDKRILQDKNACRGVHERHRIAGAVKRRTLALSYVTDDSRSCFVRAVRRRGYRGNNAEREIPLLSHEHYYRCDKRDIQGDEQPRRANAQLFDFFGACFFVFSGYYRACRYPYPYCGKQKIVNRHANRERIAFAKS